MVPGNSGTPRADTPKKHYHDKEALAHTIPALLQLVGRKLFKTKFLYPDHDIPQGPLQCSVPPEELQAALKEIISLPAKGKEATMYKPISRLLALLSGNKALFIPWDHVTTGIEGENSRQDIIAVKATAEDITKFHTEGQERESLPKPFRLPSGKTRIFYSDVLSMSEVKRGNGNTSNFDQHVEQLMRYLFVSLRYQPRYASMSGILAYHDGFYTIRLLPDGAFYSKFYAWDTDLALAALQRIAQDIETRPFTAIQFTLSPPDSPVCKSLENCYSRFQYTMENGENFQLYDLSRGHGWGRNSYVGVAVKTSTLIDPKPDGCAVIKSGWHDVRRTSSELEAFGGIFDERGGSGKENTKKRCTAGIIRVDLNHSKVIGRDTTICGGEELTRDHVLLVFKTIGDTLADCKSVMDFLKAMYDLVEVHRVLVEDHEILHRDISWTNVLINVLHFDDGGPDDFCGRPFIDDVLGVPKESQRAHAALSDLDNARLMRSKGKTTGEITGTPAFMATALCKSYEGYLRMITKSGFINPLRRVFGISPTKETLSLPRDERAQEVMDFFSMASDLYNNRSEYVKKAKEKNTKYLIHAPHHDAESIFWLIVFFFIRAHPADYDPGQDDLAKKKRNSRTEYFEEMLRNSITKVSARDIPDKHMLPPQLQRFHDMLDILFDYFSEAWYCPDGLEDTPGYRFHGHNALQHILLREIRELEEDIQLKMDPLPVDANDYTLYRSEAFLASLEKMNVVTSATAAGSSEPQSGLSYSKERPAKRQKLTHGREMPTLSDGFAGRLRSALDSAMRCKVWYMGEKERLDIISDFIHE